jgi:hypothetical protein
VMMDSACATEAMRLAAFECGESSSSSVGRVMIIGCEVSN